MDPADEAEARTAWQPPFCAHDGDKYEMDCPACGAKSSVCVREHATYIDSDEYEAFCEECHVMLSVWACVDIAFASAELRDTPEVDEPTPTGGGAP